MYGGFVRSDENSKFDKIVWNDFKQPQAGPKGVGQDARSNLSGRAIHKGTRIFRGFFYG